MRGTSFWDVGFVSAAATVERDGLSPAGVSTNRRWLVDSRCEWDLVDARHVSHINHDAGLAAVQPNLWTVNGVGTSSGGVPTLRDARFPGCHHDGGRCVDHGYVFHWPAGRTEPYFITLSGSVVHSGSGA